MYKNSRMLCYNCGKRGHTSKMCRYPTNSYGCLVYRKSSDQTIRYLMVQKKYTPEYIELLRGRYYDPLTGSTGPTGQLNYKYLLLLIADLPLIERNYINCYPFDYLWKNIWRWVGTDEQMMKIQHDYPECEKKFNRLKQGFMFDSHGFLSFQMLFKSHPTTIIEPEWEVPKGKRRENESDQSCAIRECCEETSLEMGDFKLFYHVKPFQERFKGVNDIEYCNSYYLAELTNPHRRIYYDPTHVEQNKEIRKIGWFTEQDLPVS